jgi:cysteinyl-tRNA synthetase
MANDAPILLFDTMTGEKRAFAPLDPREVGVYCCGPTVYDMAHVGHARAALAPDILVRFLRQQGHSVKYVRNVTDVDDKIIKRANERGETPTEVAEHFTDAYRADMAALHMLRPDVEPKVTEHVAEIIALIERLVELGLGYAVDGDVYYAVESFEAYGRLSKRNLDDMMSGARVEVDTRKRHPGDFALWKAAKPGEPSWPSPWGDGRPGWHIECSAMSCKHLGERFDIHTGGRDLIFPHHENEIAQSCGALGADAFARTWVHNGFVNFAGTKMSKSLGNFFTLREILEAYPAEAVRFFLLAVHYRSGVNFDVEVRCPSCAAVLSEDEQREALCAACGHQSTAEALRAGIAFPGLEDADERVAYVYDTLERARAFLDTARAPEGAAAEGPALEPVEALVPRFEAAMRDDLNTAAGIAAMSEALSEVNRVLASGKGIDKPTRWRTVRRFVDGMGTVAAVLGNFGQDPGTYLLARRDARAQRIGLDVAEVERLLEARTAARASKDWAKADEVREALAKLGVKIKDGTDTTTWTL